MTSPVFVGQAFRMESPVPLIGRFDRQEVLPNWPTPMPGKLLLLPMREASVPIHMNFTLGFWSVLWCGVWFPSGWVTRENRQHLRSHKSLFLQYPIIYTGQPLGPKMHGYWEMRIIKNSHRSVCIAVQTWWFLRSFLSLTFYGENFHEYSCFHRGSSFNYIMTLLWVQGMRRWQRWVWWISWPP